MSEWLTIVLKYLISSRHTTQTFIFNLKLGLCATALQQSLNPRDSKRNNLFNRTKKADSSHLCTSRWGRLVDNKDVSVVVQMCIY